MTRSPERIAVRSLPLFFLIACQGETTTPTAAPATLIKFAALVTDTVVATLAVVPNSLMVFVGDPFKITAKPKNAAGQLLAPIVRWTVSDLRLVKPLDSLKAAMTFKALRVGTASIKAVAGTKNRSAKAVVRGVAGAKVVVTPATATVATGSTSQFVATGVTQAGEPASVSVVWKATGGTVSGTGSLKAGTTPGTYSLIATARFGAADTSIVTITAAPKPVTTVVLIPASASVAAGATKQFFAYGRTSAGDSVPVSVTYTATGGTISAAGLYSAGSTAGTYRVIARTAAGVADTAQVVISAGAVARVTLLPNVGTSRAGATTQFVASAWNASGVKLSKPMTYNTTCGTVSSTGLFTAPQKDTGVCLIMAAAEGKADTTEVALLPNTPTRGVPYGIYAFWSSATAMQTTGTAAFTASHDAIPASGMVSHIDAARGRGIRLVLVMTGGAHSRYKTDGVFDEAKWQAAMDAYDTPAIRSAVATGVADGTIIGNSVMDEPNQSGGSRDPEKTWGPVGTMTKARVDGLCAYVKSIFPTLPTGVFHDHVGWESNSSYRVCDFIISQYVSRKGSIVTWRDAALAMAARDGIDFIFSLNVLNGAPQDKIGVWDCPGTGGLGSFAPNCRMTPAQVRDFGKLLGQAGCALLGWRYDAAFMGSAENQAAFSDVALTLSRLPRRGCGRAPAPNTPPRAVFASSCSDLSCSFTDESRDEDGIIRSWSWEFGDGNTSSIRHASHTYDREGEYQVTLTVTDDDDAESSVTRAVTVTAPAPVNTPPVAIFVSSCNDLACSFTDESTDDDGTVEDWSWDFGDGAGSTSRHPTHSYTDEGSYQVSLTVKDDKGAPGSVTHTVAVTAPPPPPPPPPPPENLAPSAAFSPVCTELSCSFTDESIDDDGTVVAWNWDFGDGGSSTERHPSHGYEVEGSYQVTLVVTDDQDATGTVTQMVTATAPSAAVGGP